MSRADRAEQQQQPADVELTAEQPSGAPCIARTTAYTLERRVDLRRQLRRSRGMTSLHLRAIIASTYWPEGRS